MIPKQIPCLLILILTALLLSSFVAHGQDTTTIMTSLSDDTITKYHLKYTPDFPKHAKENNISGKVIITFDIDSTCSILNRKVTKSAGYGFDESALAMLDKMQKDFKRVYKCKCKPTTWRIPVSFKSM